MIEFKNVTIKYSNRFYSLMNFNMKINSSTLLLGDDIKSSAILRTLAKIDKYYKGDILLDQKNIKKIKNKDLNIAYVSRIPTLFENKTIEYNLIFPLKIRKYEKVEIDKKIDYAKSVLKDLGLDINKTVNTLNKEEKKIITLLRSSLRQPKYILIEYFFENLDEKFCTIANKIIQDNLSNSIIIASEDNINSIYKDFQIISLN